MFAAINFRGLENAVLQFFKCLTVAFWLFFGLALLNQYVFRAEVSYMTVRLVILGALVTSAYQNLFDDDSRIAILSSESKVKREHSFAAHSTTFSAREEATPKTLCANDENAFASHFWQRSKSFQQSLKEHQPNFDVSRSKCELLQAQNRYKDFRDDEREAVNKLRALHLEPHSFVAIASRIHCSKRKYN
ncbi:hypothetical protein KIN20_032820 [Parelaphostrongylus tenuis]|uniref:Uncharacterized protein n=1 Tax=Parelaphostrongylus tenuis TaxID=148309 RepID=A0AAD5R7Q8_PARTN|nr:hypothetical protein KIN20_032820 [Parelaphostrongylus tenuis]